jgi:hypothetical protein
MKVICGMVFMCVSAASFANFDCKTFDGKNQLIVFDDEKKATVVLVSEDKNELFTGRVHVRKDFKSSTYDYNLVDSGKGKVDLLITSSLIEKSCRARVCPTVKMITGKLITQNLKASFSCK